MTQPNLVVSNASPLITLAKIGQFGLLEKLFGRIIIPQAVFDEVVIHSAGGPGASETNLANWIKVRQAADSLAVAVLQENLGAGESEAIVWRKRSARPWYCWMMRWPGAKLNVWDSLSSAPWVCC